MNSVVVYIDMTFNFDNLKTIKNYLVEDCYILFKTMKEMGEWLSNKNHLFENETGDEQEFGEIIQKINNQ
jgi:sulfur relay (sulfurtransferase) DsrF/TusC family protein